MCWLRVLCDMTSRLSAVADLLRPRWCGFRLRSLQLLLLTPRAWSAAAATAWFMARVCLSMRIIFFLSNQYL
jgi:hypothetical protein